MLILINPTLDEIISNLNTSQIVISGLKISDPHHTIKLGQILNSPANIVFMSPEPEEMFAQLPQNKIVIKNQGIFAGFRVTQIYDGVSVSNGWLTVSISESKFYNPDTGEITPLPIKWWPTRMEWSNYITYGPDNSIDFNSMQGVIASNMYGKTAIIDILILGLYNESKGMPAWNFIRNKAHSANLTIYFTSELRNYIIKREDDRESINVRLFEIIEDKEVPLNVFGVEAVYRKIKSLISSYEAFIRINIHGRSIDRMSYTSKKRRSFLQEIADITDITINDIIRSTNELLSKLVDFKISYSPSKGIYVHDPKPVSIDVCGSANELLIYIAIKLSLILNLPNIGQFIFIDGELDGRSDEIIEKILQLLTSMNHHLKFIFLTSVHTKIRCSINEEMKIIRTNDGAKLEVCVKQ